MEVSSQRCKYKRMRWLKDWLIPALEKRGTNRKWWRQVLSPSLLEPEHVVNYHKGIYYGIPTLQHHQPTLRPKGALHIA